MADKQSVIVTGVGAPSGIGRRVARRLASDGYDVAVGDILTDEVNEFARELAGEYSSIRIVASQLDVSEEDSVKAFLGRVESELAPLHGLVNPAGIAAPQTMEAATVEEFDRIFAVNCRGTFLMMREAVRLMKPQGAGRIVNFSSITAFDGGGTYSKGLYAGAKSGVIGLTRGGAREFGKYGITVNVLAPGPIDTEIMGGKLTDDRKVSMAANIPLQRVGQPEEVAGVCAFLMSDDSSLVNGTVINVDGGKHMR